jgi:hypothetical protein
MTMTDATFKYDVAFSFTSEDEPLANDLNDLLQDAFNTFIYSKKQEEIAGTDGEQSFGDVFGRDARFVVVLFRSTWGTTPWTRIEQTAIRNRAFNDGYDFTLFLPTEASATLPPWVPKNRLWIGLERWGLKGAASVIEARVRDAGGTPRVESPLERAARLKRVMDFETERKAFLGSEAGVKAALQEVEKLIETLATVSETIKAKTDLSISVKKDRLWIDLCAGHGCLGLCWHGFFSNTLDDSHLELGFWNGTPLRPGRSYIPGREPRKIHGDKFIFDIGPGKVLGWTDQKKNFVPAASMSDWILKLLMDLTHKRQMERRK